MQALFYFFCKISFGARLQDQVGQIEIIPTVNCNEKIFAGLQNPVGQFELMPTANRGAGGAAVFLSFMQSVIHAIMRRNSFQSPERIPHGI